MSTIWKRTLCAGIILLAITPATGITARQENAAMISGRYDWTLEADNGWRVAAQPVAVKPCGGDASGQPYNLSFFKKGENNPFEKRSATMSHRIADSSFFIFNISREDAQSQAGALDYTTLMQKLSDPKLSTAEREALMQNLAKMQEQMQANLAKMTDPANIAKEREKQQQQEVEFGCHTIRIEAEEGSLQEGSLKGELRCSQQVGAKIPITVTMKYLGR